MLLTLEAMKLEHPVHAPEAGTVTELLVLSGKPGRGRHRAGRRHPEAAVQTDPKARSATPE